MPPSPRRRAFLLTRLRACAPALLLAFLAAPAVRAQEHLPDLTPSEFEIQGELEINLPQIERQPLSGFGPPPRTFVVPAERQPATRPYGPGFEGLPALALAPPPGPAADLPAGRLLRAEAGVGVAAARYARLDVESRSGPVLLFADAAYDGVGATVLFGDEAPTLDAEVRYDRFDVHGGLRSTGAVRAGLEGRYAQDAYSLPRATLGSATVEPERTVRHAALRATLDADGATPAALRLALAHTGLATDFGTGASTDNPDAETRFDAEGHVELLRRLVRVEGAVGTASFSDAADQTNLLDYEAGLVLQAHRPGGAEFALGARHLGYRTTTVSSTEATTNVFAPVARIEVPVGLSARLFAYTDPGVAQRDFTAFFAENPYAVPAPLAPDVNTVDAQAGFEVHAGAVGFRAYGGAVYSPTRLFFEHAASGLYTPGYAKARVFEGGADLTVATDAGVEASLGVAYRDGALTALDESIPFFAPVVGRAGVQVPFAAGRGRLGLSAYAEGARPTDRLGTRDAPGWATLSAYGAYDLTSGFGVVLRGERLLGRAERWEGYPQVPYAVMLGVRLLR